MPEQCYGQDPRSGDTFPLPPEWVPCGAAAADDGTDVSCCKLGSLCLSNRLCKYSKDAGFDSDYYWAQGCTTDDLDNPVCSQDVCRSTLHLTITWLKNDTWGCCGETCQAPYFETLKAPAPDDLLTTVKLGPIDNTYLNSVFEDVAPETIQELLTTNLEKAQAAFQTFLTRPTFSEFPSRIQSYYKAGFTEITYTDFTLSDFGQTVALSTGTQPTASADSSTITAPPMGFPQNSGGQSQNGNNNDDSSGDDLIGVYVGVPIAVVVIIAIIAGFFFWRWRKKRHQKIGSDEAGHTSVPPMSQGVSSPHTSVSGAAYQQPQWGQQQQQPPPGWYGQPQQQPPPPQPQSPPPEQAYPPAGYYSQQSQQSYARSEMSSAQGGSVVAGPTQEMPPSSSPPPQAYAPHQQLQSPTYTHDSTSPMTATGFPMTGPPSAIPYSASPPPAGSAGNRAELG